MTQRLSMNSSRGFQAFARILPRASDLSVQASLEHKQRLRGLMKSGEPGRNRTVNTQIKSSRLVVQRCPHGAFHSVFLLIPVQQRPVVPSVSSC
jgi:hypothetical protein